MSKTYTTQELIKGCIAGKRIYQKELYHRFSGRLFFICLRYGTDYADAEDMLQESFLKIFSNIHKYQNSGSFEGWMCRVTTNNCIDMIRKKPNLYTISEEYAIDTQTPDINVLDEMYVSELLKLVNTLPSGYRIIFNMYVVDGYKHKEIAQLLGISEGTSKSQLARAKNLLKKKINDLNGYIHHSSSTNR